MSHHNDYSRLKEENNTSQNVKVSVYIPTHQKSNGDTVHIDKTRLKNVIREVKKHTLAGDLKDHIKLLNKKLKDEDMWLHLSKGLGIFTNGQDITTVQLDVEIDTQFKVDAQYFVSPLVLADSVKDNVVVLELNLNQPRLFVGSTELRPFGSFAPMSMEELLEEDHETNRQFRNYDGNWMSSPAYHGHGGSSDQSEDDKELYLNYISNELEKSLKNINLPLFVMGDDHTVAQFEDRLSELSIDEHISGNYEHMNQTELYSTVRKHVSDFFIDTISREIRQFKSRNKITDNVTQVIDALSRSAVRKLYVPLLRETNDTVSSDSEKGFLLENYADSELEKLINLTVDQGGDVQVVPISEFGLKSPAAALRF